MNILSKTSFYLSIGVLIASCATGSKSVDKEYWKNIVASDQFKNEKKIYKERTGKDFCWNTGVSDFLINSSIKPKTDCFYPSSKMFVDLDDSLILKGKTIRQGVRELRVLQVAPEGFLVKSPNMRYDQTIYIHKTDESGIVGTRSSSFKR